MARIDALEVGIHLDLVAAAAFDDVLSFVVHLVQLDRHVVIHAEGLADRVVGEGMDGQVLSAEVANDVRRVQVEVAGREEGVLAVAFAVGVGYRGRVDLTTEVTLGGRNLNAFEVLVLGIDNTRFHAGLVANHQGDAGHRHVGLACLGGAERFGNGDHMGFTLRRDHAGGVEAGDLDVHLDAVLRGGNQLGPKRLRLVTEDFVPVGLRLLSLGEKAQAERQQ